jgi:hypothetical protein
VPTDTPTKPTRESAARLSKPAKPHNPLFGPGACLCVECSRQVLAQRCPKVTVNPHLMGSNQQCGNWKGHGGLHTLLLDTTFLIAEERVRLDA